MNKKPNKPAHKSRNSVYLLLATIFLLTALAVDIVMTIKGVV